MQANEIVQPSVQTFRAATPRAALAAVKAALGPDAQIVSCTEVGGWLLRRREVEVNARAPHEPVTARDASAVLRARGLDPMLADELAAYVSAQDSRGDDETPLRGIRRHLRSRLTISRPAWHPDPTNERAVVALIGPTGVGKTTTIAKIGARAVIEYGLRVAMITIDHHRVGAVQQLGRYGELMGIPVLTASTSGELDRALDATADAELVLVDTAGRSPSDHGVHAQQASLLRMCPFAERHLVIPASTSSAQLQREFARYRSLSPQRLIVSKVDEAGGAASVLSVAAQLDIPLSAMTDGQCVPDDLKRVNVEWMLDCLSEHQEVA